MVNKLNLCIALLLNTAFSSPVLKILESYSTNPQLCYESMTKKLQDEATMMDSLSSIYEILTVSDTDNIQLQRERIQAICSLILEKNDAYTTRIEGYDCLTITDIFSPATKFTKNNLIILVFLCYGVMGNEIQDLQNNEETKRLILNKYHAITNQELRASSSVKNFKVDYSPLKFGAFDKSQEQLQLPADPIGPLPSSSNLESDWLDANDLKMMKTVELLDNNEILVLGDKIYFGKKPILTFQPYIGRTGRLAIITALNLENNKYTTCNNKTQFIQSLLEVLIEYGYGVRSRSGMPGDPLIKDPKLFNASLKSFLESNQKYFDLYLDSNHTNRCLVEIEEIDAPKQQYSYLSFKLDTIEFKNTYPTPSKCCVLFPFVAHEALLIEFGSYLGEVVMPLKHILEMQARSVTGYMESTPKDQQFTLLHFLLLIFPVEAIYNLIHTNGSVGLVQLQAEFERRMAAIEVLDPIAYNKFMANTTIRSTIPLRPCAILQEDIKLPKYISLRNRSVIVVSILLLIYYILHIKYNIFYAINLPAIYFIFMSTLVFCARYTSYLDKIMSIFKNEANEVMTESMIFTSLILISIIIILIEYSLEGNLCTLHVFCFWILIFFKDQNIAPLLLMSLNMISLFKYIYWFFCPNLYIKTLVYQLLLLWEIKFLTCMCVNIALQHFYKNLYNEDFDNYIAATKTTTYLIEGTFSFAIIATVVWYVIFYVRIFLPALFICWFVYTQVLNIPIRAQAVKKEYERIAQEAEEAEKLERIKQEEEREKAAQELEKIKKAQEAQRQEREKK